MDKFDKDFFPRQCLGCYDDCYHCHRKICEMSAAAVRELAAARKMRLHAISRMQRDVEEIETKLQALLATEKSES